MHKIVSELKNISDLDCLSGCSEEQILEAENTLKIKFPSDFVEYVKEFGVISFYGTEWTGLNVKGYLNVVETTLEFREVYKNTLDNYFVIENIGIDNVITVVNEKGEVFEFQNGVVNKIGNSLVDYLGSCVARNS